MQSVIVLVSAAAAGLLLQLMLELLAQPLLRRWRGRFVSVVVRRTAGPARLVLPLIASRAALPFAALHGQARTIAAHALFVPLAYALSWLAIRCTYLVDDRISGRFSLDGEDNLRARRVRTQLQVLRRVVAVALILLATGVVLLSFGRVRAVGASLLASAGVIGIVAGVAAQSTLANLFAGIQIAFSQPFRVDDVLVVDGQWGRVEEITLSYVVLRLWDQRTLILPISQFTRQPFQNWTRSSSALTGTVEIDLDFAAPVTQIRRFLLEKLAQHPLWNGVTGALQVTDSGASGLHVRALVSAHDAPALFDLRCDIREQLLAWIAEQHPDALPQMRIRDQRDVGSANSS